MAKNTPTLAKTSLRVVPENGGKVIVVGEERGMDASSFHHTCVPVAERGYLGDCRPSRWAEARRL
jgi:hypothetical protein